MASSVMVDDFLRAHPTKEACCPVLKAKRVGKHWLYWGNIEKGRRAVFPQACLIGPDKGGVVLTLILILAPTAGFFVLIAPNIPWYFGLAAACSSLAVLASYGYCAGSDPGIVRRGDVSSDQEEQGHGFMMCSLCDMMRPTDARHCRRCNACILDLDHHCPWIGKCVGRYTIMAFWVFFSALVVHTWVVGAVTAVYVVSLREDAFGQFVRVAIAMLSKSS